MQEGREFVLLASTKDPGQAWTWPAGRDSVRATLSVPAGGTSAVSSGNETTSLEQCSRRPSAPAPFAALKAARKARCQLLTVSQQPRSIG